MNAERWERVQTMFHDALERPVDARHAFVTAACGDDAELAAEVLSLLDEDARRETLLDRGVADAADHVLRPARMPPVERLGPYRLTRVLGEGGMGVVYLGQRDDLGSVAAIKILRDAWLSPARRERFAAEQRTLAQLRHPSIAQLFDAGALSDGTPWLVMEYVEGVPLTQYCHERAPTLRDRLTIVRKVCEAVQHAHQHLVIHRDLKPSNILVTAEGAVKLLDFGIAKQLESLDRSPGDQTQTALRLMTPAYAAPEQVRGGVVGVHTDVYGLGVVLYELLTGRLPFDLSNRTPGEAEALIVEREPERPSAVARRESATVTASRGGWTDLDVLCLTAMHKDPERRYRSVDALIRDLDHFLRGEPLEARPDSTRYRVGKFVRRQWRPLGAAAVVIAMVVSLVAFYTVRLTTARNVAVAEAARTQRIQRFMLDLFQGGDAAVGPSDSLRVITLVDQGLREAQGLSAEPAIQAELYHTLGDIYRKLGNLPRADTVLQAALTQRQRLFGPEHADVAGTLVALGMLRDAQAQFDEAERLVGEGIAMYRRTLPADHPAIASATWALGQILNDRGAYERAVPVLEEAVRLFQARGRGTPTPELATALTELANGQFYLGRFDVADSLNRRTVEMHRQLHGPEHPLVADALINLGAIKQEQGKFAEAEHLHRQALAINRAWYGDRHPETASSLTMLGRALVSQQRLDDGATALREAVSIQEHVYGPVHPRVASAVNELGRVAQLQGKLDEAEAHFRRMTGIYRSVYADQHYYIGIALSNLAGVYHERKEFARAVALFEDVLRRYAATLPADHQLVGIAQVRLGRSLLGQRAYQRAADASLAGYVLLMKQSTPPAPWIQRAREDLVAAYGALGRREEAERFRRELAADARPATGGSKP